MNDELIKRVVEEVIRQCAAPSCPDSAGTGFKVPVGVSARHVHLCAADVETLFGRGYQLTRKRDLKQPGQFLCEERVTLIGPKGVFQNVAILGPVRAATQVEISLSDSRQLGLRAPVAMSGSLEQAADIMIASANACIRAEKSLIVARNHVHMSPEDAKAAGVKDGDLVDVLMPTERPMVFRNVPVRAGNAHSLEMHIDFDEANACMCGSGDHAILMKPGAFGRGELVTDQDEPSGAAGREKESGKQENQPACLEGRFITERQMMEAAAKGCRMVAIGAGTILSPLARDIAARNHITVLTGGAAAKQAGER